MEIDINTQLANAWAAIDRLSVIWKSDQSNKIKRNFSMQWLCPYHSMDTPLWRWLSILSKNLITIAQGCYVLY